MKCMCKEWQENLPKVEEPRMREHARTGQGHYDGVPFRYCPWCGHLLHETTSSLAEPQIPSRHEAQSA